MPRFDSAQNPRIRRFKNDFLIPTLWTPPQASPTTLLLRGKVAEALRIAPTYLERHSAEMSAEDTGATALCLCFLITSSPANAFTYARFQLEHVRTWASQNKHVWESPGLRPRLARKHECLGESDPEGTFSEGSCGS